MLIIFVIYKTNTIDIIITMKINVNDINFIGDNIVVTRKGKQVDVSVTGAGAGSAFYKSTDNPVINNTMADGDRWFNLNSGRLYTWIGIWVEF